MCIVHMLLKNIETWCPQKNGDNTEVLNFGFHNPEKEKFISSKKKKNIDFEDFMGQKENII